MPRPSRRTRSKKRIRESLPGGATKVSYKAEGYASPRCKICGRLLAGISGFSASKAGKLNRSRKRIRRVYGGQVCHRCIKIGLKQAARTL